MPHSLPLRETDSIAVPSRALDIGDRHAAGTAYEAAFDGIVRLASGICHTPRAGIMLVEQERQRLKTELGLDVRALPPDAASLADAQLAAGRDFLIIHDTHKTPSAAAPGIHPPGGKQPRFYAGALVRSGPRAIGALCVLGYEPRGLGPWQIEALILLRDQTERLLDFHRHHAAQRRLVKELNDARDELQRQVCLDPLTGLLNRRALEARLLLELESIRADGAPGAILMLDLDDFKLANDTRGHLYGDGILIRVAGLLRRATRATDVAGRWGGDEFMLLLPSMSLQQAGEVALRISRAISRGVPGECKRGISASIGIAPLAGHHSVSDVISAVDAAMYEAKRSGAQGPRIRFAAPREQRP